MKFRGFWERFLSAWNSPTLTREAVMSDDERWYNEAVPLVRRNLDRFWS